MDPERDGYIGLEEESTTSPQPCADSPKDEVPHRPRPADDDAALSDGSTAELVEAGVPEEPCFYGHGPAWNNRQWRGWKPRDTHGFIENLLFTWVIFSFQLSIFFRVFWPSHKER